MKLVLSVGLLRHPLVTALPARDRWAFVVLATMCLDRGGRLPDYPDAALSDALGDGRYAMDNREVHRLIERLDACGLVILNTAGHYVINPLAYEEVER
jgi:hypothetical protein